jgi:transposase-like protein
MYLTKTTSGRHTQVVPGKTHRIGPNLMETTRAFASEENCHEYLAAARWPNGVRCLKCDHNQVSKFVLKGKVKTYADRTTKAAPDRYLYQCLKCRYQFAATTGTILSDTHLPLSKWMLAVALMSNAKKGLSAKQLERDMGVSYKTAWYLNQRIREAMADERDLLSGIVEADGTYVGGKPKNMRAKSRAEKIGGRGVHGKRHGARHGGARWPREDLSRSGSQSLPRH